MILLIATLIAFIVVFVLLVWSEPNAMNARPIKEISDVVDAVVDQTHDDGQKTTQVYTGCDGALLCELTADQMYLVDYTLYGENVARTNQAILMKRLAQ